jgi:hypothetical protein
VLSAPTFAPLTAPATSRTRSAREDDAGSTDDDDDKGEGSSETRFVDDEAEEDEAVQR